MSPHEATCRAGKRACRTKTRGLLPHPLAPCSGDISGDSTFRHRGGKLHSVFIYLQSYHAIACRQCRKTPARHQVFGRGDWPFLAPTQNTNYATTWYLVCQYFMSGTWNTTNYLVHKTAVSIKETKNRCRVYVIRVIRVNFNFLVRRRKLECVLSSASRKYEDSCYLRACHAGFWVVPGK